MINPTEVNSLIRLLDDPDSEIFEHVYNKLFSYGAEAITYLESAF
jgi:succinate dehydrogenase flavin-adding protein (antitoxin of CptAB toxin-antitoxin module)